MWIFFKNFIFVFIYNYFKMKKYKLKEICLFNNSSVTRNVDTINIVINYLDTSNLIEGVILDTPTMLLSDAPSRAQRKVKHNTILYSSVRPNQKHYGILKNPKDNLIVSTGFITIDVKDEYLSNIDPYYLYTLLIQNNIIEYLQIIAENSTSAYPSILSTDIANLEFTFPSIKEQHNIANILFFLSQKIALNKAINHNLAAMAKQLYDYWFVQFDFPNEEGKPYKSSGGKMVWNEKLKREIPEGWEMKELGELIIGYQQGLIRSNQQLSNLYDYPYLKMGDLNGEGMYSSLNIAKTNATPREVEQYSLKKGDFLINVRNSREIVGKTCVIDYVEKNTLYNHMLVRLVFVPNISSYYMNILFNTYYMNRLLDGLKQGTTTVIALYREDLNRIPIIVATNDIMLKFKTFCSSILDKKENIAKQLSFLTKQREELLPLLMNGQVTVG